MKRLVVLVPVLLALLAFSIPTAHAASPFRVPIPPIPYDIPADSCGFPIHVDVPVDKEYMTVTTLADGTQIWVVRGSLKQLVTNENSGKSILVNSSAPGTFTIAPDGSFLMESQGEQLVYMDATQQQQTGLPGLSLITGQLTLHIGEDYGDATLLHLKGRVRNLCPELA